MVVREHFEPVVHAAQHQLGGEHVGDGAVLEGDVELAVVLDVFVVGAEKAAVAVAGQARELVRAARHGGRTDRAPAVRAALDGLEIEAGRQRMAPLADKRAAPGVAPDAVHGRVRAAVRLTAEHPEDLGTRLLDDLALLLDRGRVDPVLGVAKDDAPPAGRVDDAVAAGQRLPKEGFLAGRRAKRTGKRLLDEDMLARLDRLESGRLVGGGRRADVDDVDVRQHGGEIWVRGCPALVRECVPTLGRRRRHAGQPHVDAVHATIGEQVEVGGESRADDPNI